jgi:hypothetical protein
MCLRVRRYLLVQEMTKLQAHKIVRLHLGLLKLLFLERRSVF